MDKAERAQKIKLLIFDVDGVLTGGHIIFSKDGEAVKEFYAQDGLGISLAHKAGIKTAIITGRESEIVNRRGAELKIGDVYQGAMDKVIALSELQNKYSLTLDQIGYVGDDINDLPVMVQIGLPCAVANAVPEVKAVAKFVTTRHGGNGAVREVIEFILKAQGHWDGLIAEYMGAEKFSLTQ